MALQKYLGTVITKPKFVKTNPMLHFLWRCTATCRAYTTTWNVADLLLHNRILYLVFWVWNRHRVMWGFQAGKKTSGCKILCIVSQDLKCIAKQLLMFSFVLLRCFLLDRSPESSAYCLDYKTICIWKYFDHQMHSNRKSYIDTSQVKT